MKGRKSGMPDETYWTSFFDADVTLDKLLGARIDGHVIEFGCGYGSFTVSAAQRTAGYVTALDIEPEMVACVRQKVTACNLTNIQAEVRDFVTHGTGVATASQAHAMIFNLLHSVIHWCSDIPTPRGPSLSIRPTPE